MNKTKPLGAPQFRQKTIPQQLAEFLKSELLLKQSVGDCLPPINELAKRFQVSTMTLRAALSILSQQGFIEIRHGSGTYVSDVMGRGQIALLLHLDPSLPGTSSYWMQVCQHLRLSLHGMGIRSRLYVDLPRGGGCPDFLEDLSFKRLSGAAVIRGGQEPEDWVKAHAAADFPVVGCYDTYPYSVSIDYESFIRAAVDRLVRAGRSRIGFVGWNPLLGPSSGRIHPVFEDQMKRHGLEVQAKWSCHDIHPSIPGAGWSQLRELWTTLKQKPDGLIVTDDILCNGVVAAIREMNLVVPDQIEIVTHGNKGSGLSFPFPVHVCEVDPQEVAASFAMLISQLIQRSELNQRHVVVPMKWKQTEVPQEQFLAPAKSAS